MTDLAADCDACAALCCMVFEFARGEDFAVDKPAGAACPMLGPGDRCVVHEDRAALGFAGCIGFDCLGAGQRVTQEVFGGRHWRAAPELAPRMIEAFRAMREVHRQLHLVTTAGRLPLSPCEAGERAALLALLDPPVGWDESALAAFEGGTLARRVTRFLAGLRDRAGHLPRPAPA